MRMSLIGIALLLASGLAACAATRNQPAADPAAKVHVQVRNDGFWDATIYLMRESSERVRLGVATGNATTTFPVARSLVGGLAQLRFLVDWIGRSGRDVSESITAVPGDTIELIIRD